MWVHIIRNMAQVPRELGSVPQGQFQECSKGDEFVQVILCHKDECLVGIYLAQFNRIFSTLFVVWKIKRWTGPKLHIWQLWKKSVSFSRRMVRVCTIVKIQFLSWVSHCTLSLTDEEQTIVQWLSKLQKKEWMVIAKIIVVTICHINLVHGINPPRKDSVLQLCHSAPCWIKPCWLLREPSHPDSEVSELPFLPFSLADSAHAEQEIEMHSGRKI